MELHNRAQLFKLIMDSHLVEGVAWPEMTPDYQAGVEPVTEEFLLPITQLHFRTLEPT
jgi:hypothetical protein